MYWLYSILGKELLAPLVFSFLFAMLLLPLARFLEKKCRFPRGLACMVSVLLFTAFIVLIGYVLGMQAGSLSDDIPKIREQLNTTGNELHRWLVNQFHINVNQQIMNITKEANSVAASAIGTTFLSVSSIVLFLVFIFIYTFFCVVVPQNIDQLFAESLWIGEPGNCF